MTAPERTVGLPCGRGAVRVRLPGSHRVRVLETRPASRLPDPDRAVAEALAAPTGSPPLAQLARGRRSACVVVSDRTRPVPNRVLVPPVLGALEAAGVARGAITVLVATGMHGPTAGPDLDELLGPAVTGAYRVVNHDCRDRAGLQRVGEIQGVPIEVNRRYLDADLKILTGLIEPHGFAGFSGGGKSVVPGLAGFDTLRFFHGYDLVAHPGVALGRIRENPFRDHVDRVAVETGAGFLVNAVLDQDRRLAAVVAGHPVGAFRLGCRIAGELSVVRVEAPADLVITTGGGHPLDASLYQATKGLFAVKDLVRPGGTILWVAGCGEGAGSATFGRLVRSAGSAAGFRARHRDPARFVPDQWAVQAYFQVLERAGRVLLHSPGLDPDEIASLGLVPVADPAAAVTELVAAHDRAYVVPEGPYLAGLVGA